MSNDGIHDAAITFFGEMVAPAGLAAVGKALARCPWPIEIRRSNFDRSEYLHAQQNDIWLDMETGQSEVFEFHGYVYSDDRHARLRLSQLSECLVEADIAHKIILINQNTVREEDQELACYQYKLCRGKF